MTDNSQKKNYNKASDKSLSLNEEKKIGNFSNLLNELTSKVEQADLLYKNNKLEDAKNKLIDVYKKIESEFPHINAEYGYNEKYKKLFLLYKKTLSNIALFNFIQKSYKEAIIYDLKLIIIAPKNDECIVRLFKSYSKINKCSQAVFYGGLFMELDKEIKDKYTGLEKYIEEEKNKLKKIHQSQVRKNIFIFSFLLIIPLSVLLFYFLRK